MSYYGQKNYPQIQGIKGRYSISAIGCFLTAFCNLESDFDNTVDPLGLNNYFVSHGTYIDVDDGVRDDLGWGSITAYDNLTQVTTTLDHGREQSAGWPASNKSIVRFYYRSISHPTLPNGQPNMIFHFCKVADPNNHTIVDSWDGVIKQSPYGEPTAWATFNHNPPVPVTPPPEEVSVPSPAPPELPKTYLANTVNGIRFEAVDGNPQQMWIIRESGAEKWDFKNVKQWRDFKSVQHLPYAQEVFIAGIAHHPIPPNGADYYLTVDDFGTFKQTGQVQQYYGINKVDLSGTRPKPLETTVTGTTTATASNNTVTVTVTPTVVTEPPATIPEWLSSYKPFVDGSGLIRPVKYVALKRYVVNDFNSFGKPVALNVGTYITIAGTFLKDGKIWGRPQDAVSHSTPDKQYFYGVPMDKSIIEQYGVLFDSRTSRQDRRTLHTQTVNDHLKNGLDEINKVIAIMERAWDSFKISSKNKTKK